MRNWFKWMLFISSYTPLLAILFIRNFDFTKSGVTLIFLVILSLTILFANLSLFILLKKIVGYGTEVFKPIKVANKSDELMNYIVTYVIPFLNFDISKWQDIGSLLILLLLVGVIYIESNLVYINPMLSLYGYRILEIEVSTHNQPNQTIIVISNGKKFGTGTEVKLVHLTEDIYVGVKTT